MSTTSPPPSAQRRLPKSATVEVRCWLLRDRPLVALLAVAALLGVLIATYMFSGSMVGTLIGLAALLVVMRRFYLPITFRFDAYGISRRVSGRDRRIAWSMIIRYEVCRHGVVLYASGADYRLAAGQGLFIPWGDRREEILSMLAQHVQ